VLTIGIDPGISGAIAVLCDDRFIACYDMPTMADGKRNQVNGAELARIFFYHDPDRVIVERVHSMPGQGVASTFAFGQSFGVILGVVSAMGYPVHLVTPQQWKRCCGLKGKDKEASRSLAQQKYPQAALGRKKDAGRADAILIARYGVAHEV